MKKIINAIGLACPQPVVFTKNALENMANCNILEVYVDNEIAVQNVIKFAKSRGLETSYQKRNENEYCINILPHKDAELKETNKDNAYNEVEAIDENRTICDACINYDDSIHNSDMIVVISSDKMGEGDSKLGAILIKGFIYALTQLEELPKTIIMYNSGAKLSVEGSTCLEDLMNLEKLGVEILTCGTCLKYYNIEEKLAVGTATNMYTIAEKMVQAARVIKP